MEKIVVGIDIGGTNTAWGLVDAEGNLHGEGSIPTAQYTDIGHYQEVLAQSVRERLNGGTELVGIGIGAPNANGRDGTIEDAPNLPWKGTVPFVGKFRRFFPEVPVRIANDAAAATLGEMIYGAGRGMTDLVVVTLGTGLGSGFVANGKLLSGRYGLSSELGHTTVEPDGRLCGCGRRGCLETYVSATGIRRTVFELLADRTEESELRAVAPEALTAEMITNAARRGDKLAQEAYEQTGERLGRALAGAVLITGPEAIILFGGLAKAGDLIFEPTRKYLEANLLSHFKGKVRLLPSGVPQGNAAVLGAAALIWDEG